jgi:hypothetical protein
MAKLSKTIGYDGYGYFAEVYTDDDGASGYGENAKVGRWYGSRQDCEAVDPRKVRLYPATHESGVDPFDLACERRHD